MRPITLLLLSTTVLAACSADSATIGSERSAQSEASASRASGASQAAAASEKKDLATLRAATARFHRYEVARDAAYTFLFMDMCMVDQSPAKLGGMGYHYVNTGLLDDKLDVARPEALLYEPEANGRLRLVAVEYVIPKSEWTSDQAPELFGQKLALNAFDLWALHVWVWENNPSGLYASWNPRVSCDNAAQ